MKKPYIPQIKTYPYEEPTTLTGLKDFKMQGFPWEKNVPGGDGSADAAENASRVGLSFGGQNARCNTY